MALASYIFGGDTKETAESLKRKRAIAEALMENSVNDVPQNIGEGLSAVGQALAGQILTNRLEKKEKEGRAAFTERFNKALPMFGGADAVSSGGQGAIPMTDAADEGARTALGGASVDLSGDRQSFIAGLLPAAMEEGKRTGVDPRIIVAQAAQETGWGKSAPGNNFFGIKSHGKSGGNSMMTTEVIDGKPVRVRDSFRGYDSPADSVRGYGDFILENPRYKDLRSAQGLDAQLAALQASGYATDPNYSRSVGAIARGIQLPQETASATPEDAFSAVMPELGGATIDDPMLTYDEKGARMEPASYAGAERRNPYSGPGASIDTSGSTQAGGGAQPRTVAQALANPEIPAEFQGSAQLRNAMGNGRGVIQALLSGTPATDAQLGQARVRGNAVQEALASPARADNGLGIDPSVVDLLSDPYISEGQRATLQTFIADKLAERKARREAEIKRSDPAYRADLEKTKIELENLRDPKISPADQARLDFDRQKFETEQARGEWEFKDGRMYNKRTGETKDVPGGMPPAAFKDVSSLRKEIQGLPSYKNLSQALPIYKSMFETAGRDTRASDLNLVYGLGKIMDPTSVVREGEMVMVKNTSSLPDWLQGAITSLNGGAALTPETRRALLTEAYGRVQGYDQAFQQDIGQYRGIVERNNMNMDDVIPSFGAYEPWAPVGDASTPAPEDVDQEVWDAMTPEERKLWQK